jgi:outer membrane protein assembly factor BamB
VGKGFSSFAIVGNRAYTLGNTNQVDSVFCFDTRTGRELWRHSYPCDPQPLAYEGGPSSTPAVHDGHVYTFSKEGHLFCLAADSGKVVWSRKFDLWPKLEGDWPNTWRYAGSPLVLGGRLFMSIGQAGKALSLRDGSTLWESPAGHPGYASPVPFRNSQGQSALAFFSGHAVLGVAADSGRQLWKVPWQTLWDLNAADPIIHEGRMFISSGNGVGCALFDLTSDPPRELWRNKHLKNLMNTSVLWQGNLFGFNDTDLSCVAWDTGELRWSTKEVRKGSLVLAAGKLLLLSETGKLVVAEATGAGYQPLAQAQILEGRCWTLPVLAGGLLFARNAAGEVVCLDLSGKAPTP